MPRFDEKNYVDVAERIRRFYALYPEGRIVTDLASDVKDFDRVVFVASVYRDSTNLAEGRSADATGWAAEERGSSTSDGANYTSWHENCETSAIGRALANLGFVTSNEQRASKQEMEKVARAEHSNQQHHGSLSPTASTGSSGRLAGLRS